MRQKAPRPEDPAGILLVDKPPDWTSHDVVAFTRRFGFRKVGHAGTLDPDATGLLVLLIGRAATKLSAQFSANGKTYDAIMTLGTETDSQDASGEVTATHDWHPITPDQVSRACAGFVGDIQQIPPMVSAKKVKGVRLYKYARRGETIVREPCPITIHQLTLGQLNLPDVAFSVHCSKGTYVRTLCADIGTVLECGAHLKQLRRTTSGEFSVTAAHTMDTIREWDREKLVQHLLPLPLVPHTG